MKYFRFGNLSLRLMVLYIFVLAVFVRLIFVAFFPQLEVVDDAVGYDTLARSLASGRGFSDENGAPSCGRGPVYPFFLSIIYRIFGHSYFAVRIVQSFLSAIVCLLIYFIGKRVYNSTIGLIAMGLSSVYPVFISYSGLLLTEILFALLLSLTVLFLVLGEPKDEAVGERSEAADEVSASRSEQTKQLKYWILSGAFVGLATLCRSEGLLLPIIILGCWLILAIPKRELLYRFAALTLTMMFFILPWTYRNYRKFDAFIPVNSSAEAGAGIALWMTTYPGEDDIMRRQYRPDREPLKSLIANKSPIEADRVLFREAIKNIKSHPMTFLKFTFKRIIFFWIGGTGEGFLVLHPSFVATLRNKEYSIFFWKLSLLLYKFLYVGLAVLGLGSIARGLTHREAWRTPKIYLVAFIGYICVITVIFSVNPPRHSIPIAPFMIILSAVGISLIQRWVKSFDLFAS